MTTRCSTLRVVVLLGKSAARGWRRGAPDVDVHVIEAPHPSGRWLNAHPEDRAKIVAALAEARGLAGQAWAGPVASHC